MPFTETNKTNSFWKQVSVFNQQKEIPEKIWRCTRKDGIQVFTGKMSSMINPLLIFVCFNLFLFVFCYSWKNLEIYGFWGLCGPLQLQAITTVPANQVKDWEWYRIKIYFLSNGMYFEYYFFDAFIAASASASFTRLARIPTSLALARATRIDLNTLILRSSSVILRALVLVFVWIIGNTGPCSCAATASSDA